MVNEAVACNLGPLGGNCKRFTVADGTTILKGTILAMTDPRTAIATSSTGQVIAGIASMDKLASDGSTEISVYTEGDFDLNASGAITVGAPIYALAYNEVALAPLSASGAQIIGYALETATDNETIQCRIRIGR